MSRSDNLVKSTAIFAVGTFGSKVLAMLVVPFCTHFVDTVGMGSYDLVYTASELLKTVAILCIPEALFRWIVDKSGGHKAMLSTWAALYVALIACFTAVYWVVWAVIQFSDAVILYLMISSGSLYMGIQFGVRGVHRNKLFAGQGILYAAIMCLLTFAFVVPLGLGYIGLLLAILFATILTTGFCILKVPEFRDLSLAAVNLESMRKMLRYAIPLIPNQVSWWCITSVGKVAIATTLGVAANGIYAVASRFPSAVSMLTNVFQTAWQEQAVLAFSSDDRDEFYTKVFAVFARGLASVLLVLIPFTGIFILLFTTPEYHGAKGVVCLLYIGAVFTAYSSFYGTLYMCSAKTEGAASTTIVGALLAVVLNFILVRPLGLVGVALSVAVSQLVVWLVRIRQTRTYATIRIRWLPIVLLLGAACILSYLVAWTSSLLLLGVLTVVGGVVCLAVNREVAVKSVRVLLRRGSGVPTSSQGKHFKR